MTPINRLRITVGGSEHLDDEYRKIVSLTGEMMVEWAHLDTLLARTLAQIAGCNDEVAEIIYYTPSAFSGRLEIIRNLTSHLMPEMSEKRELLDVFSKIDKLHKTRNSLAHSMVYRTIGDRAEPSRIERLEIRPSTKAMKRRFKAQAHDIEHHLQQIDQIMQYLFAIGVWTLPKRRSSVRYWANIVLNR